MNSLTPKQADVLSMIERHTRRYGYAPSIREIASKTKRSKTAAHQLVVQLERRGAISRKAKSARTIQIGQAQ